MNQKNDKNTDSLFNLLDAFEKPMLKDYVKYFSFFCFYKIFKIKIFQDGLIQLCFPKEQRVWENYMVQDIKKMSIEGPKSLQIVFMNETINLEVF